MQTTTHQARALTPDTRRALETLLGRALHEEETVTVTASNSEAALTGEKAPTSLPVWPGRVIGSLRRNDIYEDVR